MIWISIRVRWWAVAFWYIVTNDSAGGISSAGLFSAYVGHIVDASAASLGIASATFSTAALVAAADVAADGILSAWITRASAPFENAFN